MDVDRLHSDIFRGGSKTYYGASRLFPKAVRRDVFVLYAFVRVADNLVDDQPVFPEEFRAFRQRWRTAWAGTPAHDAVIDPFVELARRKGFDPQWVEDFLTTMETDLEARPLDTLDDVLRYTWGSAEVIGLFMIRLLGIPDEAKTTACLMGRSMQFINFLRDIAEDHALGRRYLPLGDSGLESLTPGEAAANPDRFRTFLRGQTAYYTRWQTEAREGYAWLPWRFRLAIKTASDLYNWTARVIQDDPMVVWKRKVKPSQARILFTALGNLFYFPPRPRPRRAA
ncbi:MAG TPA: phytoene/squalene synthase family protein [Spirochaetia bacterium]|nr:phytoene/squalene synthase family protein [Spirochaetia bacterium]